GGGAGGNQLDACVVKSSGQFLQAGLVVDGNQCAADSDFVQDGLTHENFLPAVRMNGAGGEKAAAPILAKSAGFPSVRVSAPGPGFPAAGNAWPAAGRSGTGAAASPHGPHRPRRSPDPPRSWRSARRAASAPPQRGSDSSA